MAIVDCRFSLVNPGAGELAYQTSHLPGAVFAHLDRDLSDHRKHGQGRHPWPDAADFTARLGEWGITPQHQVIAYDDGEGAYAARLWFLMRALGRSQRMMDPAHYLAEYDLTTADQSVAALRNRAAVT